MSRALSPWHTFFKSIAVPRYNWNRSMAARMSSRFCVGAWTTATAPAKDTTLIRSLRLSGIGCPADLPVRLGDGPGLICGRVEARDAETHTRESTAGLREESIGN